MDNKMIDRGIEKQLSACVGYLKTVTSDTSNEDIAEALGLSLDDFTFSDLIGIGELSKAARKFPRQYKEFWRSGISAGALARGERDLQERLYLKEVF